MGKQKITPSSLQLSEREIKIIRLLCQELSNREISEKLFISIHTVEKHRENIMKKTGARNLAGITKYAIEYNIVPNRKTEIMIGMKILIAKTLKGCQENPYKRAI
jgi:DNA-binding CsgD family transcriptional regulator